MNKRSQAISMDLIFAVIIILSIITTMSVMVEGFTETELNSQSHRDMEIKAQSAINSLTETGGNPIYWEEIIANETG